MQAPGTSATLSRALASLKQGRLPEAETLCRSALAAAPQDADAVHLLGLVLKQAGRLAEAEDLLRRSTMLAPARAEFHANYANLLRAIGRPRDAELEYRTALQADARFRPARLGLARLLVAHGFYAQSDEQCRLLIAADPSDADAWFELGNTLRGAGQLQPAAEAMRQALAIETGHALARHNLGALLRRLGQPEAALAELEQAARSGLRKPELHLARAQALQDLGRFDEAEEALEAGLQLNPAHVDCHVALGHLRYMRGRDDPFRQMRDAVAMARGDSRLRLAFGNLLRQAGLLDETERELRVLLAELGRTADVLAPLAVVVHTLGRYGEAVSLATEAAAQRPDSAVVAQTLTGALLSSGRGAEALKVIGAWRLRQPLDQSWIAYEASALRLVGDTRYRELYDYERLVMPFDLEPPPGWALLTDFNRDLIASLERLHQLKVHPLDQSLRHGTQTQRSLLKENDPVIQAFLAAIEAPIARYREAMGHDPEHPLRARNQGPTQVVGCWSVRLGRSGYHVNHNHPEGWISSAYYVQVPPEVADTTARNGWIKFGEPGIPIPGADAEHYVQPRAGRLVLFPSYMWHGTMPITGDAPRMTIAFDMVPRPGAT
jgi:tetratricopeptide (TPR) repeat protein